MRLKSFEAHGFKSFADRVSLDFEPGITAIVGPNGSGKSNISDAIRWVMGEQSIKYLRGTKMEDVIFAGSSVRRAMGMAEVTLLFDNSDHELPLDFDQVSLCRRVYRSGESEYFINKKNCRLKDVLALLADTGLGRGSMSIIGQNKIDEILNSRPEDRRSIFEEAAGIAKYRMRKKEALRKLEETGANLLRIRDIRTEIQGQLEPLGEAAAKAHAYKEKAAQLKLVRLTLLFRTLEKIDQEKAQLTELCAAREQELLSLQAQQKQVKTELQELNQKIQEKEDAYSQYQEEILAKEREIASYGRQLAVYQERLEQGKNRLEQLAKAKSRLEGELEISQRNLLTVTEEYDRLEGAEARAQKKLAVAGEEKNRLSQEVQDAQDKLKTYQDKAFDSMRELVMARNTLTGICQEQDRLHRQQEQSKEKLAAGEAQVAEAQQAAQAAQEELQGLADRLTSLEKQKKTLEEELLAAAEDYRKEHELVEANRRSLNQKKARLQVLSNMEREHEGFIKGVKNVLGAKAPWRAQVYGVTAELFHVEDQYVTALETALGGALQNIITQDAQSARDAIGYLKRQQGGRATFLPLDTIRPRSLYGKEKEAAQAKGIVGVAADLVTCDEKLRPAVQFLLGTVLVAENLDDALAAARKADMRVRIVTLDGDVISAGGSMSGGQKQQGKSFLARRQEIVHLTEEVQGLEKLLQQQEKELDAITQKGKEQRQAQDDCLAELQKLAVRRAGLETQAEQKQKERQEKQEALELLREEKRSQTAEFLKLVEQRKQLEPQVAAMEQADAREKSESQELEAQLGKQRQDLEQASGRYQDALVEASGLKTQLEALNQRIQTMDSYEEKTQQELSDNEAQQAKQVQSQKDSEAACQKLAAQAEALKATLTGTEDAKAQFLTEREALAQEKTGTEEKLAKLAGQEEGVRQKIRSVEMEQVRKATEQSHCLQQLQETYQVTEEEARNKSLKDVETGDLHRQENQLSGDLEAMGAVNLTAEEEYQTAKERYDFLNRQYEDMTAAKEQLETVIASINSDMARRFREAFAKINSYFAECYEQLFGGGKARLRILDENHILESGIDIEVQPPGKKMRNLSLFSGGERALTVIALLFALLKYQPAPFVILDEIDAPLDETNISRFARFLREYGEKTQFIVITHRKGTMEAADVLHGVTMEQSGISRILSVKLSEVAEA